LLSQPGFILLAKVCPRLNHTHTSFAGIFKNKT
jgi:hypothetical protein